MQLEKRSNETVVLDNDVNNVNNNDNNSNNLNSNTNERWIGDKYVAIGNFFESSNF